MSNYYDVNEKIYQCKCGWSGTMDDGVSEPFDQLMELYCPKCNERLDVIVYPTYEETMQAAADGKNVNPADVAAQEIRKELSARWEKEKLNEPNQLPDIQGDNLEFVWDQKEYGSWTKTYYVITHNGELVWKEPSFYEDAPRFPEIVDIFKKKYGSRFKEMAVTWSALGPLMGDKLGYWRYVKGYPILEKDGRKRWDLTT